MYSGVAEQVADELVALGVLTSALYRFVRQVIDPTVRRVALPRLFTAGITS
ncbi:hypothetical protein [Mycobacterium leprae]|uniref:hypothetical protein n=1 Tax=Mycobacterium leprae TaxID=1769 RepID=UPI0002F3B999|nr:hypothetical protein [Mycobacterium leprae]